MGAAPLLRMRAGILFRRRSIYHKPTWNLLPGLGVRAGGCHGCDDLRTRFDRYHLSL